MKIEGISGHDLANILSSKTDFHIYVDGSTHQCVTIFVHTGIMELDITNLVEAITHILES